jgi:ribosome-binding factor A
MVTRRQERVSELLREELSLLVAELTDPRLDDAMVNVTDVRVSADLRTAHVYLEHALGPAGSRQVLAALEHAQSFLRHALLENLELRFVPDLFFHIDSTAERARHLDELLNSLVHDGGARSQQEHDADATERTKDGAPTSGAATSEAGSDTRRADSTDRSPD